jgi:heterodisulfide reductase subunit A
VVLESACLSCGQCAAACPAAIIKPLWEEEEGLQGLLSEPPSSRLVLACSRISQETLAMIPEGVRAVSLSCAGRVSPQVLLALLSHGFGRVVVAACHPGNCRSLTGSARAGQAVAAVREWLEPLGLPPSTVSYVPLAPHQNRRLLGALGEEA